MFLEKPCSRALLLLRKQMTKFLHIKVQAYMQKDQDKLDDTIKYLS